MERDSFRTHARESAPGTCVRATAIVWLLVAAQCGFSADATNAPAPAPASSLEFLDGSMLLGALDGINAQTGVRWKHPGVKQPIEFASSNLHQVRFAAPRQIATTAPASCRFRFANGDEVIGELVSLDAEVVVIDSWFGGKLRAPRKELRAIAVNGAGNALIYEGPLNDGGWKFGGSGVVMGGVARPVLINPAAIIGGIVGGDGPRPPATPAWTFKNNGFISTASGTLGRDFKLPPVARVEFDLAWKTMPSMRIALYTDVIDRMDYNAGYQFYISSSYVYLYRRTVNEGGGMVFSATENARVPQMNNRSKVRFEMRINKEKETAALYADGTHVKTWRVSGPQPEGTGILFYSQRTDGSIRVSNLRVSAWDGREEISTPTNAMSETLLHLANSDRVAGKVNAIKDGKVAFAGPAGELQIPLQRATQIFFPSDTNAPPANATGRNVRASLVRGDSVTFTLDRWEGAEVTGTSANFGKVTLRVDSVKNLLFNPESPRPPADDLGVWDDSPFSREE